MIAKSTNRYGPESSNLLDRATTPGAGGARAVLESFYYALNQRDSEALRGVWSDHELAQLNNPVGGILHGGDAISELYERIFHADVRVEVTFQEIVEYIAADHAVFAGREIGTYTIDDTETRALAIRTTRYFTFEDGRWSLLHHHGSIDDPKQLADYQAAVRGEGRTSRQVQV